MSARAALESTVVSTGRQNMIPAPWRLTTGARIPHLTLLPLIFFIIIALTFKSVLAALLNGHSTTNPFHPNFQEER